MQLLFNEEVEISCRNQFEMRKLRGTRFQSLELIPNHNNSSKYLHQGVPDFRILELISDQGYSSKYLHHGVPAMGTEVIPPSPIVTHHNID